MPKHKPGDPYTPSELPPWQKIYDDKLDTLNQKLKEAQAKGSRTEIEAAKRKRDAFQIEGERIAENQGYIIKRIQMEEPIREERAEHWGKIWDSIQQREFEQMDWKPVKNKQQTLTCEYD